MKIYFWIFLLRLCSHTESKIVFSIEMKLLFIYLFFRDCLENNKYFGIISHIKEEYKRLNQKSVRCHMVFIRKHKHLFSFFKTKTHVAYLLNVKCVVSF